jgi:hypothetical protein
VRQIKKRIASKNNNKKKKVRFSSNILKVGIMKFMYDILKIKLREKLNFGCLIDLN